MNRRVFAAALSVLLLPVTAAAQLMPLQDDPSWGPRFRITPFVGHLPGMEREEEWQFRSSSGSSFVQADMNIASGTAVGLNLEAPLRGRIGITAAALYGSRDESVFVVRQTAETFGIDGSDIIMGRLGVSLQLREAESELFLRRLNASVFAGGTILHERPRNEFQTADFVDNATHFGANIGVNAELPFASDRLAVQLGIEDHIMWWRDSQLDDLAYEYFGRPGTSPDQTSASADTSHGWMLRAGLSFRFR